MTSIAIMFAFALMLFLPCAVALIGSREPKHKQQPQLASSYADRLVHRVTKHFTNEEFFEHYQSAAEAYPLLYNRPIPVAEEWGDLRDPLAPVAGSRPDHGRVAQAEMEALRARAVAARAHAEALAAVARAAAAKAEAAAVDARMLEEDAAQSIQDIRFAA